MPVALTIVSKQRSSKQYTQGAGPSQSHHNLAWRVKTSPLYNKKLPSCPNSSLVVLYAAPVIHRDICWAQSHRWDGRLIGQRHCISGGLPIKFSYSITTGQVWTMYLMQLTCANYWKMVVCYQSYKLGDYSSLWDWSLINTFGQLCASTRVRQYSSIVCPIGPK